MTRDVHVEFHRIQELKIPLLIVVGFDDAAYLKHAASLKIAIPSAEEHYIAGAGHFPYFERPDS